MAATAMLRRLFLALGLLAVAACGDDDPATGPQGGSGVAALEVTPAAATLHALGDSMRLTATARDADGDSIPGAQVTWSSTDTTVAKVNPNGWVFAAGNGTAGIIASSGRAADTAAVTVEQLAATIMVTPATLTLAEGDTARLTAVVADSNGVAIEGAAVTWTSADETAATVDAEGLVTAVRAGTETSVIASMGSAADTAAVSVLDQIAFSSFRDGTWQIYVMNADGSGQKRLSNHPGGGSSPRWSPDGARVAYEGSFGVLYDILVVNADGSGLVNLTNNPANDFDPVWSPDGSRIAYVSDRDGFNRYEIYVINADGSAQTRLTDDPVGRRASPGRPTGAGSRSGPTATGTTRST